MQMRFPIGFSRRAAQSQTELLTKITITSIRRIRRSLIKLSRLAVVPRHTFRLLPAPPAVSTCAMLA